MGHLRIICTQLISFKKACQAQVVIRARYCILAMLVRIQGPPA